MTEINVKWSGLDKLMEELSATAEATIEAAASAMKTTTGQVQAKAKEIAPKRTGVMAGNINVMPVKKSSTSVTGTIEAEKYYSSFVEFGTYKMHAEPFMRPAVDWGQSIFIKTTMEKLKGAAKLK